MVDTSWSHVVDTDDVISNYDDEDVWHTSSGGEEEEECKLDVLLSDFIVKRSVQVLAEPQSPLPPIPPITRPLVLCSVFGMALVAYMCRKK